MYMRAESAVDTLESLGVAVTLSSAGKIRLEPASLG